MSSKPTPNLKQNTVLAFDDGLLTIKQSGHGDANGWGELAFHERQVEIDPDGFHKVEIPPSELRELRDFLNRTLPAAETGLTPQDELLAAVKLALTVIGGNAARDALVTAIAKVEGRS